MINLKAIPGLLSAIILHEIAHAYVAYFLGDETAKAEGRLSINPIKHLDPIGLLSMLVFRFGWAKAVPINPEKFKRPSRDIILVSMAGPIMNLLLAFVSVWFLVRLPSSSVLNEYLQYFMWYNIMLGVFNLLPIPPLDGSKVLASLLPHKYQYYFYKYQKYTYFLLIILVVSGAISHILGPIIDFLLYLMLRLVT